MKSVGLKSKIIISILIVLVAAGVYFRNDIANFYNGFSKGLTGVKSAPLNTLVNQVEKKVVAPPPLKTPKKVSRATLTDAGVIEWTNTYRGNNNLQLLSEDIKLDEAANLKLKDMFKKQYFEHVSPSGVGPAELAQEVGYDYIMIGENLALGIYENDKDLVDAWMASPGHRANILNLRYTGIGVAVGKGLFNGEDVWLAVQEFGLPLSACPVPDEMLKTEIGNNEDELSQLEAQIGILKQELNNAQSGNRQAYIQILNEYNSAVDKYNNLLEETKQLINQYNNQVKVSNTCIDSS